MKLIEDYKKWKLENPDEDYQSDEIHEFLANYGRGEIHSLLEHCIELEQELRQILDDIER